MRDEFENDYYVTSEEGQQGWCQRFGERMSTWLGAGLALVLIFGLVLWGYRLGQRDASAVPVIRAALDPAKVQPDDPGGVEIAYQDITSYDAGANEPASSEITFAPPTERPAEEDMAMGALQEPDPDSASTTGDETGEAMILTAATATGDAAEVDGSALDATEQAPDASPVAPTRPGDLSERMAIYRQSASAEAELASRAAASAVHIQLGAFPDRAVTKSEWARIYKANEDILSGRALVVQSTISGGRRFFRLRAGPFKDRVEARNVCRALQARGQDCLVAVNG